MRTNSSLLIALVLSLAAGCTSVPTVVENPLIIPATDFEYVWKQTVEVVDEYFDIASENRVDGRIDTYPQPAATLLEPWHHDSTDGTERLEATLQSIRRRAFIHVTPGANGYVVQVEVHKELEDLPHPAYTTTGDATFRTDQTVARQQQIVGPLPISRGWIHQGRDWKLENRILEELACRFGVR